MSTKESQPIELLTSLESIKPPEQLLPPAFPTMQELIMEQEIQQRTPPSRQRLLDLFDGLLGDLAPLLEDFSLHPEKYGAAQAQLLEQLASGSMSLEQLTKNDRSVLNLAVFDYTTPAVPKPPAATKQAAAEEDDEDYDIEEPEDQFDIVETELPTHWWLL
jgi:hypothetical protein